MDKSEKIKLPDKTIDIEVSIDEVPYELCYWCKYIIRNSLITATELDLPLFNDFLRKLEDCSDEHAIQKVMRYNVINIKRFNWMDSKSKPISSRFHYFKSCIIKGLKSQNVDEAFISSITSYSEDDDLPF